MAEFNFETPAGQKATFGFFELLDSKAGTLIPCRDKSKRPETSRNLDARTRRANQGVSADSLRSPLNASLAVLVDFLIETFGETTLDAIYLQTNRLVLREWNENDVESLVEGLNQIEVSKWLAFIPFPYKKEDAIQWVDFCNKLSKDVNTRIAYHFAIALKSEQKVIGGVSLERINRVHGTAGGGIWINLKYHGRGYGTEAFNKRTEFAFKDLNLRRIENGYFDGNEPSLKMQENIGYKVEGTRRKAFICMATGEIMDEHITGLLREEWKGPSPKDHESR